MQEDDEKYEDTSIVCVFEFFGNTGKIHVQVVKDTKLKNLAQTWILENVNMNKIPKNSRKFIWNAAMKWVACK